MNIRAATVLDQDVIHRIYWAAFEKDERDLVSQIAVDLLSEKTSPKTISLVAEIDNIVVGHVAFSPVKVDSDETFRGFILAPLAVLPDHQKQGIGSNLIEHGIQLITEMEADILFVYGDPNYYSRFGFSVEPAERYRPPYKLQYPFGWQAIAFSKKAIKATPTGIICSTSLSNAALW